MYCCSVHYKKYTRDPVFFLRSALPGGRQTKQDDTLPRRCS